MTDSSKPQSDVLRPSIETKAPVDGTASFPGSDRVSAPDVLLRVGLLFAYAALVAARLPEVLIKGRFWGEEGAVYFINARTQPWLDALFAVHTGYLNLAASLATLLAARAVPLDQAPWVSTIVALLIQLCPALLLLTSDIPWLRTRWAIAVALLMVLLAPTSGEVWLNSITSQFHLGLCAALILAMPTRRGAIGTFRAALLLCGPLSGPASAFLAPLFLIRGILDRSRDRILQCFLLGGGSLIQVLTILMHPEPRRSYGVGVRLFALVVYEKNVLLPFVGMPWTQTLTQHLALDFVEGRALWRPILIGLTGPTLMIWAAWRSRNTEVRWLLAGGLVVMTMAYFGALGRHVELLDVAFGDRYSYVPSALFGLMLFGIVQTTRGWLRGVAVVLVWWLISTGAYTYLNPRAPFTDGPVWPAEVAKWRSDPQYRVQFWPNEKPWLWYMLPSRSCVSHPLACSDRHE